MQDLLAQRPGAQSFLPCPDLTAASTAVVQVITNIGFATATANAQLEGVKWCLLLESRSCSTLPS